MRFIFIGFILEAAKIINLIYFNVIFYLLKIFFEISDFSIFVFWNIYSIDGFLLSTDREFFSNLEYLTGGVFSDSQSPDFWEVEKEKVASSHSRMSQLHGSLNFRIAAFPAFVVLGFCHFRNHCRNTHNFVTKAPISTFSVLRELSVEMTSSRQSGWLADDPPTPGSVFSRFSRRGFVDVNSQSAFRLDQNRETRGHHYTPPPGVPRVQEGTKF